MSNKELDQTALSEADAARAANNDGKEFAMEDEDLVITNPSLRPLL